MKKTTEKNPSHGSGLEIIEKLAAVIAQRAATADDASYTAKLLRGAPQLPAKKFGEEAVELALAAVGTDKAAITAEAADVIYHLLVLLESRNVALGDVLAVLEARMGTSGLAEKAARGKP